MFDNAYARPQLKHTATFCMRGILGSLLNARMIQSGEWGINSLHRHSKVNPLLDQYDSGAIKEQRTLCGLVALVNRSHSPTDGRVLRGVLQGDIRHPSPGTLLTLPWCAVRAPRAVRRIRIDPLQLTIRIQQLGRWKVLPSGLTTVGS